MKYSDNYLYSKDIDWFCIVNGIFIHVASAGGMIPNIINDREKLRKTQRIVLEAPYLYETDQIFRNTNFIAQHLKLDEQEQKLYFSSFIDMARKGFVSFDRSNIENPLDNTYHIVCMPPKIEPLNITCEFVRTTGMLRIPPKKLNNFSLLDLINTEQNSK